MNVMGERFWATVLFSILVSGSAHALTAQGAAGKEKFVVCNACHNPVLEPPLAPPMWGVQRRYKRVAKNKEHFIDLVSGFAKAPSLERAILKNAVEILGLMPPLVLPDEDLREIAAYIWEEQFAPPCAHWRYGAAWAEERGDLAHAEKDRRMLKRFCGQ